MAQPITYRAVRERFQMPGTDPNLVGPPDPSALMGPVPTSTAVATPGPDELLNMALDQERQRIAAEAASQVLPKPEPQTEQDAAILDLVGPQGPPEMVKPPSLHTPEEIQAGIGDPYGPPTLSRPLPDRGEAPMPPGGQDRSKLATLAKILGVGLQFANAAGRGAAAGEKSGSFLGGWGAASEAEHRRGMQDEAFRADQQQKAARTAALEQETRLRPEELAVKQQNQQVLNFQRQKQAEYMDMLKARIAQQMQLEPEKLRREDLNIIARMAEQKARRETELELMRMRLAKSPQEAELLLARIESEHAQIQASRSQIPLRQAQTEHEQALTKYVGKARTTGIRMESPGTIRKQIVDIQNSLRNRYTKFGKVDENAMRKDPDYSRLQDLERLYNRSLKAYLGEDETGSGGGLLDRSNFILDFRQEEGRDPTTQEIEQLHGVAWQ